MIHSDPIQFCFLGLGWATAINSFLVSIYYNMIIAWCLFYFFASFRRRLSWGDCGNWWNTERCVNPGAFIPFYFQFIRTNASFCVIVETLFNSNSTLFCRGPQSPSNCTMPSLPPEEYFEWIPLSLSISSIFNSIFSNYLLRRSDSLDNLGSPSWSLALCLLLAWILVGICIIQGIKSSGKVSLRVTSAVSWWRKIWPFR